MDEYYALMSVVISLASVFKDYLLVMYLIMRHRKGSNKKRVRKRKNDPASWPDENRTGNLKSEV